MPTTTRYYTIPGSAWLPYRDTYDFVRTAESIFTYTAPATFYAAVNLPHGAVVTELSAWLYDNEATDIPVTLYRMPADGLIIHQMAYVTSSGASAGYRVFSDSTIVDSTIDNYNNAYVLQGMLISGDDNHRLGQVRITYTIDEPLP